MPMCWSLYFRVFRILLIIGVFVIIGVFIILGLFIIIETFVGVGILFHLVRLFFISPFVLFLKICLFDRFVFHLQRIGFNFIFTRRWAKNPAFIHRILRSIVFYHILI